MMPNVDILEPDYADLNYPDFSIIQTGFSGSIFLQISLIGDLQQLVPRKTKQMHFHLCSFKE